MIRSIKQFVFTHFMGKGAKSVGGCILNCLCYHPYHVFLLFGVLLSPHHTRFSMPFILHIVDIECYQVDNI